MLTLGSASRARVSSIRSEAGDRSHTEIAPSRLALVVDDVEKQAIHRDGIGSEHDLPRVEHVAGGSGKGTAVPDRAQSVHDLQHRARAQRLDARQRADHRVGVRLARLVRARDVREAAVGDVLEAAGNAGGAVILHVGDVDDLRQLARDEPHEVRSRVFLAEEIRLDIGRRVVAGVVGVAIGVLCRGDLQAFGSRAA